MIVFKAIKSKGMRTAVFREEFNRAQREMAKEIKKDYVLTVRTWEHEKPKFETTTSIQGVGPTLAVTASGGPEKGVKKWMWIDEGTKRHRIKPKKAKYLRFTVPSSPKTQPRVIGSGTGSKGNKVIFMGKKGVMHPGTKPRKWTEIITQKWKPIYTARMNEAIRAAAKQSGMGI